MDTGSLIVKFEGATQPSGSFSNVGAQRTILEESSICFTALSNSWSTFMQASINLDAGGTSKDASQKSSKYFMKTMGRYFRHVTLDVFELQHPYQDTTWMHFQGDLQCEFPFLKRHSGEFFYACNFTNCCCNVFNNIFSLIFERLLLIKSHRRCLCAVCVRRLM